MSSPYRVGAIVNTGGGGDSVDHASQGLNNIHIMQNYAVADMTALLALSITAADVGKVAKMASPAGFFILLDHTGPTWRKLGSLIGEPNITVSVNPPADPSVNDIWIQIGA